jgi:phosphatidylserine/phosphatidylglycerophosphate/cardiolipin synthase-like enzyme
LIVADPGSAVSARFTASEADLVRLRMGPYFLYAFSGNPWLQDVAPHPCPPDVAAVLAPQARIVDFTGYYLAGEENPAYQPDSAGLATPAVTYVSWDEKQAKFLPSTAQDWRPWPWPPDAEPYILGIHGSSGDPAFVGTDMREAAAPWAVGSWIRGVAGMKVAVRPLEDPVVLMSCGAARSVQTIADETGRMAWGPTGDISLGAEPVSLTEASAGVRVIVSLHRTTDGRPGRFRSSYPQGPAGDLIRHAYRERLGKAGTTWLAGQFAPAGATAPRALRPRAIVGYGRLFGWSFYDERDWDSRRAAFGPVRIDSSYVTWTPAGAYQPGTPRQLDPRTGKIAASAEPWHVSARAALPFDAGGVLFAAGYFARGHFLVTDQDDDVTYLDEPLEFGLRLRREHEAATAAGLTDGRVLPRTVMLLADHEPVPRWAARLVARGLGAEVITVSLPATLFLDDNPGAGIPATQVALLPWGSHPGTPEWTRTTPAGASAPLTAPPTPERQVPRLAERYAPVPGSGRTALRSPGPARPRELAHVRHALEARTGLPAEVLQPAGQVTAASVLVVRTPVGIDFVSPRSQDQQSSELESLQADGAFELLEINGEYNLGALARIGPVTGQPARSAGPMLVGRRRALPFDAEDNPLYVIADYYGGYFLLSVMSAADETITTRAESPRDFGRRIRAELMPAGREPRQVPAASSPVVLLARHRAVPPQVAATLAEELQNASSGVYNASMPATAFATAQGGATATAVLALVRLPGHADEPYWTLTTPAGLTSRIDAPPLPLSEGRLREARAAARLAVDAGDAAGDGGVTAQLRTVNPGFGSGGEAATNCVITAIAMDMFLAEGSDQVRFVASHASPLPETDLANYQRQVREADDDHQEEWHVVTGLESVRTVMAAAAPGSRGFVLKRPADGRQVRHVFNVRRDSRGRVRFLDGQRGEEVYPEADLGPGELVFIRLTHGIGVPEGAAPTQPDETGLTGATSGDQKLQDIVDYRPEALRERIQNDLDNLAVPAEEPAARPSTTAAALPAEEPAADGSVTAAHPAEEPAADGRMDEQEDARALTALTARDRIPRDQQFVSAVPRDHVPLPETPYLDAIEAELRKVSPGLEGSVWERTYGNALDAMPEDPASWILQVPDSWGWSPEDVGSRGIENPGIRAFLAKITANIAKAERTVDITGFGVPNVIGSPAGQFPDGPFAEAIGDGLQAAAAAAVAAGRRLKVRVLVGVVKADVTVSPWAFRDRLKQMIGADYDAVDINVAAMTTRAGTSYNHTKFVVVDGTFAIHGGINWMKNTYIENGPFGSRGYGGIAPVADLDMALSGPAATSAGKFLDILWTWTIKNASTWRRLGVGAWLATNNDTIDEGIPNLYADLNPTPAGNLQVISVGSLGYGIQKNDPTSEYEPPPAEFIDQAASNYWWWGWKSNNETNSDRDFMTVNPDANALRALIATATKKIVLSQQDINGFARFPLNHALFDVRLLDVLAAKMTAEPPVKVRIVISNPSGMGDYSNISEIKVAIMVLFRRIRLRTASDADAQRVMDRNLQLATLRVSDQPTWPAGHKYRLHAKLVSVDDKAFYIGSRNVYPDTTQDHGFIIEDAAAAHQLSATFLDKQWKYSRKAAIFDWEQTLDACDPVTTDPRHDNATPVVDRWLADRIERSANRQEKGFRSEE